jgi:hypothetical protein
MIPLFAIDPKDRIHVYTAEQAPDPAAGWTLLSLVEKDDNEEA